MGDDIWVFVNGKHAIDLGGIHLPEQGSFAINSSAEASSYGLQVGKIYQVAIYRAERKMTVSSFRISIRGFNPSQSSCSRL